MGDLVFKEPDFSYLLTAREVSAYEPGEWDVDALLRRTERETEMRRERFVCVMVRNTPFYHGWFIDVWMRERGDSVEDRCVPMR